MGEVRNAIMPQPGYQTRFLQSPADIVIGGGSAGAGKTYSLLMETLRHIKNKEWRAVIFRRTMPQIKNYGGLWEESESLFLKLKPSLRPTPSAMAAKWRFPSGAEIKFTHLQHEKDAQTWQGSQIPLICFDELTHFTSKQFFYLATRGRSHSGIRPYIRATTNPQSTGWVKDFIQWWIYPDNYSDERLRGLPIPERDGVIRYFTRFKSKFIWGDSIADVLALLPEQERKRHNESTIKSVTFISGRLEDNPALLKNNPGYAGSLLMQDEETGEQLLEGRWYAKAGQNELYSWGNVRNLFSNDFVPSGQKYMTADIAFHGSDLFVVIIWNGWRAVKFYVFPKSDGREIVENMQMLATRHGVPASNISFDADGVGMFLKGFFRTSFDYRSNSAPLTPFDVKDGAPKFADLRTQCAYYVAERISEYEAFADVPEQYQDDFLQQFTAHTKAGFDRAMRLTICSKDEVKALLDGVSPDFFDAFIQRAVFDFKRPIKTHSRKISTF